MFNQNHRDRKSKTWEEVLQTEGMPASAEQSILVSSIMAKFGNGGSRLKKFYQSLILALSSDKLGGRIKTIKYLLHED